MNIRNPILLAFCFLFLCSITAFAQDTASVCTQIETSVRTKAPSWKLARKSKSCHWFSYFHWTSGKSSIDVILYPVVSRKEAENTFQLLASDNEVFGETIKVRGTGLRELGDENRLFATPSFRARGVDFRKGNVTVRVSASTMELAIEFATFVAEALPAA